MEKRALFIGRWQPLHNGHMWLINQKLEKDIPVLIAVRDIPPDERNPFTTQQTAAMLLRAYREYGEMVNVMIVPDLESVNWGRGVGYEVNEHVPPSDIERVSATEIRDCIKRGDDSWKKVVNPLIHDDVKYYLEVNGLLGE